MAATEQDRKLEALGGFVERTSRRVDLAEKLLRVLTEQVAGLAGAAAGDEPELPAVRSWLLVRDAGQASLDLADLVQWLAAVYLRYQHAVLPSCWLWHPDVVEELCWLRQAHAEAYTSPHASYTKAGDWHDRQRPGVVQRVQKAIGGCELVVHGGGTQRPVVPLAVSTGRIAEAWAGSCTSPHPTPEELTEADHHDHTERRTSRP